MARNHYFYLAIELTEVEKLIENHQKSFDEFIMDSFSEQEIDQYEHMLDSIAPIYAQPIISELTFEDFTSDPEHESEQRLFFNQCKSSLCIENLPYFELNLFQVSYLKVLLEKIPAFMVDVGGVAELQFKEKYLSHLSQFKSIESLITDFVPKVKKVKSSIPVDPIDFLVLDVYKELDRLGERANVENQSEKLKWLFYAMKAERLDPDTLLEKCGLGTKDFDDYLEKLKFYLRKLL